MSLRLMRYSSMVACALVFAGCGAHHAAPVATPSPRALDFTGDPRPVSRGARGTGLNLTRAVSPRVRASCRRVARQTRQRVVCPRLVPRTPLSHIPYSQEPAEVERDLYVLSFNNGTIHGTLHWMTGAGTVAAVNGNLVDDRFNETPGLPTRIRLLRSGRTRIAVYRYPRDGGGFQEGHEAAFAEAGGRVIFASLHGYGHADAATAMLIDLLNR